MWRFLNTSGCGRGGIGQTLPKTLFLSIPNPFPSPCLSHPFLNQTSFNLSLYFKLLLTSLPQIRYVVCPTALLLQLLLWEVFRTWRNTLETSFHKNSLHCCLALTHIPLVYVCVCVYESVIQGTGKTCLKKVLGSGNLFLASSVLFLNTSFLKGNCFALNIGE